MCSINHQKWSMIIKIFAYFYHETQQTRRHRLCKTYIDMTPEWYIYFIFFIIVQDFSLVNYNDLILDYAEKTSCQWV